MSMLVYPDKKRLGQTESWPKEAQNHEIELLNQPVPSKRACFAATLQRYNDHKLQRDAVLYVPTDPCFSRNFDLNTQRMTRFKPTNLNPSKPALKWADPSAKLNKFSNAVSMTIDKKIKSIDDKLHDIDLQFAQLKLDEEKSRPEIGKLGKGEPVTLTLFKKLNTDEESKVKQLFNQHLSLNTVFVNAHRISLTYGEFLNLRPGKWLDDHVIDVLLAQELLPVNNKVFCFSTLFMTTLKEFGLKKGMKRRTKGFKSVFEPEMVIVPLHVHGNHWTLAVINNAEKSIKYYDSMQSSKSRTRVEEIEILHQFLAIQAENINQQYTRYKDYINCECPQQRNGSDCGVFMCSAAVSIAHNAPLAYSQQDMPSIRNRMALIIASLK